MGELKVIEVLSVLVEGTSNNSCKVSKRYFIAMVEMLRLRRCVRTQRSRMCERLTFPTWLMIMHQKGRSAYIPSSSSIPHYWCTTNLLQTCYKHPTNMLQICYLESGLEPGLQTEHFFRFVASLYGTNVATNLLQTGICYFTLSTNMFFRILLRWVNHVVSTETRHSVDCLLNDSGGCYNYLVSSVYYSIFSIDYSIFRIDYSIFSIDYSVIVFR